MDRVDVSSRSTHRRIVGPRVCRPAIGGSLRVPWRWRFYLKAWRSAPPNGECSQAQSRPWCLSPSPSWRPPKSPLRSWMHRPARLRQERKYRRFRYHHNRCPSRQEWRLRRRHCTRCWPSILRHRSRLSPPLSLPTNRRRPLRRHRVCPPPHNRYDRRSLTRKHPRSDRRLDPSPRRRGQSPPILVRRRSKPSRLPSWAPPPPHRPRLTFTPPTSSQCLEAAFALPCRRRSDTPGRHA